jgi:hypothetical protein
VAEDQLSVAEMHHHHAEVTVSGSINDTTSAEQTSEAAAQATVCAAVQQTHSQSAEVVDRNSQRLHPRGSGELIDLTSFAQVACVDGLLVNIISFLATATVPRDLIRCADVSRAWSAAAESDSVWEALCDASPLPARLHKLKTCMPPGQCPWRTLMHAAFAEPRLLSDSYPAFENRESFATTLAGLMCCCGSAAPSEISSSTIQVSPEQYLIDVELYVQHGELSEEVTTGSYDRSHPTPGSRTTLLSAVAKLLEPPCTPPGREELALFDSEQHPNAMLYASDMKIRIGGSHWMYQNTSLAVHLVRKRDGKKLSLLGRPLCPDFDFDEVQMSFIASYDEAFHDDDTGVEIRARIDNTIFYGCCELRCVGPHSGPPCIPLSKSQVMFVFTIHL